MNFSRITAAAALSVVATFAVALPASASHGGVGGRDGVRSSGSCSAGSSWTLKAKPDDGRIEIEFEVDSNRNGQTWTNKVSDQGVRVLTGKRVTKAPSGSYSVEKKVVNRAGVDSFIATAKNSRTGEVCSGKVRL